LRGQHHSLQGEARAGFAPPGLDLTG